MVEAIPGSDARSADRHGGAQLAELGECACALRVRAPIRATGGAAAGAHLQANADLTRQRLSDNGLFPPQLLGFTWYNQADLGLQASYTFDWWGKQRDAVEAAMDQAHAAQADRSAAALMLASSIADAYFGWQADQNRLRARPGERSSPSSARRKSAARAYARTRTPRTNSTSRDLGLGRGARADRDARRLGDTARRGAGGAGRPLRSANCRR